ncbi:hypothetical protein LguiA_010899 [Lonicera macranthoides]
MQNLLKVIPNYFSPLISNKNVIHRLPLRILTTHTWMPIESPPFELRHQLEADP